MDSAPLRQAYADLLEAVTTVAQAGCGVAPTGEWDARQLLAHLVAVDAGVLSAAWSVAAGVPASFDNRASLDTATLARIADRLGGLAQLGGRLEEQGGALCRVAEQLTDAELDQQVATVLVSGGRLQVDAPLPLRDLLAGLAGDHLPRHTGQLLALLPSRAARSEGPAVTPSPEI